MRAVQLADVEIAARALMIVPCEDRKSLIERLLWQADTADRYRKRLRRPHGEFGTGTLMSAAMQCPLAPRPVRLTADVAHAFSTVINALHHQSA